MPVPIDPVKLQAALADLGVFPADLDALRRMPLEKGRERLVELKELVGRNFKKAALQLHPDVTGGDAIKEAKFKFLSTVKDDFLKLRLENRPVMQMPMPMPVPHPTAGVRVVRVVTWTAASAAHYGATNSTTSTISGVPFRVAVMRPG